jgi:tetratricopeptide (TPR) repeat protein
VTFKRTRRRRSAPLDGRQIESQLLERTPMLKNLTNLAVTACLLLLVAGAATPSPQEATEKRPKDQKEYELANKTFTAVQGGKWQEALAGLDEWKKEYPESAYKEDWPRIYLRGYQQTGQKEKAIAQAKEILKGAPDDFESNFAIISLVPTLGTPNDAALNDAVAASKALLKGKPSSLSDQQWAQVQKQVLSTAHQTLGWIHMQRKQNVEAEKEFMETLKVNPNLAQVSYWLGDVVLKQGDPNKNELALFSFARAAAYEGEGSLNAQGREQVDSYLKKVYSRYAGTEEGLDELKAKAKTQPLPPADLKIESAEVRRFKSEQKSRTENPLLWVYKDLKANLVGSGGDAIWGDLQGKMTPKMALYVVGMDSDRPQTLSLAPSPDGAAEVVLNLENRLRAAPARGKRLEFEGVASSLTKEPFKLVLNGGHALN